MGAPSKALEKANRGDLILTMWGGKAEAFCQALLRGMTQANAVVEAGYSPRHAAVQGTRIMRHPLILTRLEYLRQSLTLERTKALARVEMPRREGILRDLVMTRDMAAAQNNLAARLKANELLGKELGMFVTKIDATVTSPLDALSREQLLSLASLFGGGAKLVEGNVVELPLGLPVSGVSRETLANQVGSLQPAIVEATIYEDDDPLA